MSTNNLPYRAAIKGAKQLPTNKQKLSATKQAVRRRMSADLQRAKKAVRDAKTPSERRKAMEKVYRISKMLDRERK